ncbi:hypothetical protein [Halobacillus andaensis]|uniref:hypothetical protein n=1 Tax=Halobacillus andaensis TaxID=1176239 RepID=UPI003D70CD24
MVKIIMLRAEREIGMGCCGGVCGEGFIEMKDEFKHHEADRQRLGKLYQVLTEKYGDQVHITYLDPRNMFAILIYFGKQWKNKQISLLQLIRNLFLHMKYNAVFVNGKYSDMTENCDTLIEDILTQEQ